MTTLFLILVGIFAYVPVAAIFFVIGRKYSECDDRDPTLQKVIDGINRMPKIRRTK